MGSFQNVDAWVWIAVAAFLALVIIGVLAALGSILSERHREAAERDYRVDPDVEANEEAPRLTSG